MLFLFLLVALNPPLLAPEDMPLSVTEISQVQWTKGDEVRMLLRLAMVSESTWKQIDHLRIHYTMHKLWKKQAVQKYSDTFSTSTPKLLSVDYIENEDDDVTGFDGVSYWQKKPMIILGMARNISAEDCVRSWLEQQPILLTHPGLRFADFGTEILEDKTFLRLLVFDSKDSHFVTLWADSETYQIFQVLYWKHNRKGWYSVVYRYEDYREVAGIMMAHTWSCAGKKPAKYTLDSLEVNPEGSQAFWKNPNQAQAP